MDRDQISALTHGDLPFANPLDPADIDAAIAALDLPAGGRVLDVGCGAGELLVRIKRAHPHVVTVGVEPSPVWAEKARERGVDEVLAQPLDELRFEAGAFAAVTCIASSHAFGDWRDGLGGMAPLAPVALVGEGFWERTPTPGYLEALGGASEDELPDHDGLLAGAADAGWTVRAEHRASHADWARYEEALIAGGEAALTHHDDADLRAWVDAAKGRWHHPDGQDTLGFTLLTLVR
jgi:SAM-dependent methyltransferase